MLQEVMLQASGPDPFPIREVRAAEQSAATFEPAARPTTPRRGHPPAAQVAGDPREVIEMPIRSGERLGTREAAVNRAVATPVAPISHALRNARTVHAWFPMA